MPTPDQLDHTPVTFGKHKGKTPDEISCCDPRWLVWAVENIKDKPICSNVLYRACQEDLRPNKYQDED